MAVGRIGVEIRRQEAGTGVQVSNDRASSLGDHGGDAQKEKDVWYMTAVTEVLAEGAPSRRYSVESTRFSLWIWRWGEKEAG